MKPSRASRGWFKIPGVQDGDRTLADQRRGLETALDRVKAGVYATVLDLGSAEGLISREFVLAGARKVVGVEVIKDHIEAARFVNRDLSPLLGELHFVHQDLVAWADRELEQPELRQWDLVLALGVCHKLKDPAIGLRYAAKAARRLLCFRNAGGADGGLVRSKRGDGSQANAWQIFANEGLRLEGVLRSSRDEAVEYWRRPE